MKNLKLFTIFLAMLLLASHTHIHSMDNNQQSHTGVVNILIKGISSLAVGADKVIRGHAPRLEEQLATNTLSNNRITNIHELDWATREIIEEKKQIQLVHQDRLLNLMLKVQTQVENGPNSNIQVSEICRTEALAYFLRYTEELNEELARVMAIQTFLNGQRNIPAGTIPDDYELVEHTKKSPLQSNTTPSQQQSANISTSTVNNNILHLDDNKPNQTALSSTATDTTSNNALLESSEDDLSTSSTNLSINAKNPPVVSKKKK